MERIALEVDEKTAKAWRNTSPKIRKYIEKNIERIITDSMLTAKQANFERLLQNSRTEANKNGLTEEILTQLLADDE